MPDTKTATLTTIFSEVLANLAFMFDDGDDDQETLPGTVWLQTTIRYSGAAAGTLVFRCSRDFAALLAANLLGVDPDTENASAQSEDATKEFMNIVCGQLVTALHGTEEVFNLDIPEVVELTETPDPVTGSDTDSVSLTVEGHCVQLRYIPQ